jgi:hypothetical protein
VGGWAAIFIHIYVRVPLNGMCKFSVSKIVNNVFNASDASVCNQICGRICEEQ